MTTPQNPDEQRSEVIDHDTQTVDDSPTPGVRRRIDLSSLRDVRLEMAAVYRMVNGGKLESQDGSRRVYMLRQIADVIVNAELERRIADLEERASMPARPGLPALERTLN